MPHPPTILLIFDFDNTLIDSQIDFAGLRTALVDLLDGAGTLPAPRAELMRRPILELVEHGSAASSDLARAMWAVIESHEAAGLVRATAMPHAHDVLAALAARGFRLALLTNNARPATARILDALGLAPLLHMVVTRDDVPRLKPDPCGIQLILARLAPVRTAYLIGDSWIDGCAAAAAGIRFVGFGPRRAEVEARGVRAWAWVTDLPGLLAIAWDA
jgi:phosphoglycolate phosphatase